MFCSAKLFPKKAKKSQNNEACCKDAVMVTAHKYKKQGPAAMYCTMASGPCFWGYGPYVSIIRQHTAIRFRTSAFRRQW